MNKPPLGINIRGAAVFLFYYFIFVLVKLNRRSNNIFCGKCDDFNLGSFIRFFIQKFILLHTCINVGAKPVTRQSPSRRSTVGQCCGALAPTSYGTRRL